MKGLQEQQEAARRLGVESKDFTPLQFNAFLMNRIADLEAAVARLEKQQDANNGT